MNRLFGEEMICQRGSHLVTHVDKFLPPMEWDTFLVLGGSLFYGAVGFLVGVAAGLASRITG